MTVEMPTCLPLHPHRLPSALRSDGLACVYPCRLPVLLQDEFDEKSEAVAYHFP